MTRRLLGFTARQVGVREGRADEAGQSESRAGRSAASEDPGGSASSPGDATAAERSARRTGHRQREFGACLGALAGFYSVAALYLHPIWRVWRDHLVPNMGDAVFNLYLLKWVGHEARLGFAGFWDAPFFYPSRGVLAYSDHMVGPGLAAMVWSSVVPGWVGAYNVLFLSSFALTGWAMSWVLRRSGRSWWAALLGGVLYAFCPFRWDQVPHLQVLLMAAIPVTLWSFDRLLARPSWPRGAAFLLCYALHLSGGCYLAVMIHIPLLVLAWNRAAELWRRRRDFRLAGLAPLASVAALAAGLLTATFHEYWRVDRREGLAWSAGAARHWGASLLSYLQPSASNIYAGWWPSSFFRSENCLFPGFLAVTLCLAAGFLASRRAGPSGAGDGASRPVGGGARSWRLLFLALALLGWTGGELRTLSEVPRLASLDRWVPGHSYRLPFVLVISGVALWTIASRRQEGHWPWMRIGALDPWPRGVLLAGASTALLSTPLFYLPLAHWAPGLSSIRVPARFQAFSMFTIAFFAAAAFDALAERCRSAGGPRSRRRVALFTVAVFVVAFVECAPRALPWGPLPEEEDFPEVYAWLADQPDVHALLELPLEESSVVEARGDAAVEAMYFGTLHWRPLVNGFSAHFPLDYQRLEASCCYPMPDPRTLADLAGRGVTHILIHRSRLRLWQRRALEEWSAANSKRIELVYAGGGDRVYRLGPPGKQPAAGAS